MMFELVTDSGANSVKPVSLSSKLTSRFFGPIWPYEPLAVETCQPIFRAGPSEGYAVKRRMTQRDSFCQKGLIPSAIFGKSAPRHHCLTDPVNTKLKWPK